MSLTSHAIGRLLVVIAFVFAVAASALGAAQPVAAVTDCPDCTISFGNFQPAVGGITAGSDFTFDVLIGTGSIKSRGAQAAFSFDPTVFTITSVTEGNFYSGWTATHSPATTSFYAGAIDNTAGTLGITGVGVLGATGNQGVTSDNNGGGTVLFTVHAHAVAKGTSALTLSQDDTFIADNATTPAALTGITLTDGSVVVGHWLYLPLVGLP